MRPVDEHVHAGELNLVDQALDRQHHSRLTCHVVDQEEPRPGGHPIEHCLENLVLALQRKGYRRYDHRRSKSTSDRVHGVAAGVVFVIGDQDFIASIEFQAPKDGIHSRRGVGDKGETLRISTDEGGEFRPGFVDLLLVVAVEKTQGLRLEVTQNPNVEIIEGLNAGDVVVSAGQVKLRNGQQVNIDNSVKLDGRIDGG